jgi:hypothetical protein
MFHALRARHSASGWLSVIVTGNRGRKSALKHRDELLRRLRGQAVEKLQAPLWSLTKTRRVK